MGRREGLVAYVALLSVFGWPAWTSAQAPASQPLTVDHVWREDFESGTIRGWTAYPAAQDAAGGEPQVMAAEFRPRYTIQGFTKADEGFYPVELGPPAPDPNRHYLLRASRPNSASSQRVGVGSAASLFVAPDSRLAFSYWIRHSSSPQRLRIDLAASDGKRYSAYVDGPQMNAWHRVELPLRDFRSGDAVAREGLEIQFAAIIAEFPRGDASSYIFLALDNVELNARVQSAFDVQEPRADAHRGWGIQIARRHVRTGQSLDLSVRAPAALRRVTARLEAFSGTPLSSPITLQHSNQTSQQWTAQNVYHFSAASPRGPLTLVFEGQDQQGRSVRTDVRLWHVPQVVRDAHPRVFVTDDDRQRLAARIRSGIPAKAWAALVKSAAAARKTEVPAAYPIEEYFQEYRLPGAASWMRVFRGTARDISANAWVYFLSGDEAAGEWARAGLLKMMGWKQWVLPWFQWVGRETYYPVGIAAEQVGLTYDLIFPLLSPDDAALVRRATIEKAVEPSWKEYFLDDQVPANTSNWISHTTAGPLVAAMAFYGDFADDEQQARLETLFSGLAEKFLAFSRASMKSDGSYGEGYGYQNFTYSTASTFLAALQHQFDVTGLAADLHYLKGYLYPLYTSTDGARWKLAMGDSHEHREAASNWVWFARVSNDPIFRWFYAQAPGTDWKDLLWAEDDWVLQSPETLPPNRVFAEKGNVVFRTGWGDADTVFVLRAGPNYNHNHFDQGNFLLRAHGANLVTEAGRGNYALDPYFRSYFIQAAGHNVILVDDNPESQEIGDLRNRVAGLRDYATIDNHLLSKSISFVQSELGPVYRDDVEQFSRAVYFVDGYAVIRDQIRAASPHRYHWQLFPQSEENLKIGGHGARITAGEASLKVDVVLPRDPELIAKDVPRSVTEYDAFPASPIRPKVVLQAVNARAGKEAEFLVVLTPVKAGSTQPRVEEISGEGSAGVRVIHPERTDEFYFAGEQPIRGGVVTDGTFAFVSREKTMVVSAACQQATRLEIANRPLLVAGRPINASVHRRDGQEIWTFTSDEATDVTVQSASGRIRTVRIDAGESVITLER